jgi:protein SCO1/2
MIKKPAVARAIWIALLLGPLLVFMVCNTATQNYKPVKYMSPKLPNPDGGPDSVYKRVGDFKFVSQTGDTITQDTFKNCIWVANVFFSRCQGICPKISSALTRVQENFKDVKDIKYLSITVDPENDSVQVLEAYAAQFGAIPHKWYLVTGDKAELYRFAMEDFFFKAFEDENDPLGFIHDETLRLVDKNGVFRGEFYDGTNNIEVDRMIEDIRVLYAEHVAQK